MLMSDPVKLMLICHGYLLIALGLFCPCVTDGSVIGRVTIQSPKGRSQHLFIQIGEVI